MGAATQGRAAHGRGGQVGCAGLGMRWQLQRRSAAGMGTRRHRGVAGSAAAHGNAADHLANAAPGNHQKELWNGNRETVRNAFFARRSVIRWAWTHYKPNHDKYAGAIEDPQWTRLNFVRLRSRAEVNRFLAEVNRFREESLPPK